MGGYIYLVIWPAFPSPLTSSLEDSASPLLPPASAIPFLFISSFLHGAFAGASPHPHPGIAMAFASPLCAGTAMPFVFLPFCLLAFLASVGASLHLHRAIAMAFAAPLYAGSAMPFRFMSSCIRGASAGASPHLHPAITMVVASPLKSPLQGPY